MGVLQVRNDLRAQGLEVPDAVARPAASPDLAMQALREVENQPHAGRQHNNKAEEVEISEDDEVVERGSGRRYEEDVMEVKTIPNRGKKPVCGRGLESSSGNR